MGMVFNEQCKFLATALASERELSEVNSDGNITHLTLFEPNASTAIAATNALSMPPERPRSTFSKPVFFT